MLRRALTASALTLKGVRVMSESRKAFEVWAKLAFPHMSLLKKGDTDKYVYKTANFACEAFCEGEAWQASRQALEGDPIGFLQSSGVSQLSGGHPAKLYPIGATPSPFESSTLVYTHPASADKQAVSVPEWIKCSDRLPDVLDVWIKMTDGSVVACWSKLDGDFYWNGGGSESYILENTVTHWKPRQQE